jgi:prolyl-tRNA synthetase
MELLQMGCYGIGVSRVLAAAVEVLSGPTELRWPLAIAPFAVALLAPKAGSMEEAAAGGLVAELEAELERLWPGEVVTDDRGKLTVGKKLREARKTGYPHIVLAGRGCLGPDPRLELHLPASGEVLHLAPKELVDYFRGGKQGLECF